VGRSCATGHTYTDTNAIRAWKNLGQFFRRMSHAGPLDRQHSTATKKGMQVFSRIMFVTLFVSDQDKAIDFYTAFGFEKRADNSWAEGRFLTMALKDQEFEILLWPGAAGQGKATPGAPAISVPGVLFIESDDLRKDFAELKARGVEFAEAEPETYPFGMRVTALDPDGNRVSLRQTRR
jgi:predicted enzyme related to lactoylglutathione lyase